MYIIHDRRIWGSYRATEGWRPYVGANPHTDHVHFSSSWAGAHKRTSWWDGTPAPTAAPPETPRPGLITVWIRSPGGSGSLWPFGPLSCGQRLSDDRRPSPRHGRSARWAAGRQADRRVVPEQWARSWVASLEEPTGVADSG